MFKAMSDINLLPEDLREREAKARAEAQDESATPAFTRPSAKNHTKPTEGAGSGRWQQLMSAIKKNISSTPSTVAKTASKQAAVQPASSAGEKIISSPSPKDNAPEEAKISAVPPVPPKPPKAPPLVTKQTSGTPPAGIQPSAILDVNLLPAQESKQISRKAVLAMSLTLFGALALVGLVYVALSIYVSNQRQAGQAIQQDIITLQDELEAARAQAEAALETQYRISLLGEILKTKGTWQKFFSVLESQTIPTVTLTSLAADVKGVITVTGQAPSFTEVGRQMLAFAQSSEIKDIVLSNMSVETGTDKTNPQARLVNFTFALKVAPDLFISN